MQKVKRRIREIARKAAFAGVVVIGALMFGPATLTAQQGTMNVPSGEKTEQTAKENNFEISSCGVTLDQLSKWMKKGTDQDDKATMTTMNAVFNAIEAGGGKAISGTDTIMGTIGGSIIDVTTTPRSKQYFTYLLSINSEEFEKSLENGAFVNKGVVMDEKNTNFLVELTIVNGGKLITNRNIDRGTNITIAFWDKKNSNKKYVSVLRCPEGCEVPQIIPFFGQVQNGKIQFGVYYKYIQNGKENRMIGYTIYNPSEGSATISYFKRNAKGEDITGVGLGYHE